MTEENIYLNIDKNTVGLGDVDNTSDLDKPISNATQSALNSKVESVTGTGVDNTDPINPTISIDKHTIGLGNVDNTQQIPLADKGANNGVAELDSSGKVPISQLPSYVSDVETYPTLSSFPTTGVDNIIYIAEDTNLTYRWTGSAYVEISPSIALGETSSTAYRGDRGKIAYDHSLLTSGNPHNVTKSDVGLSNVDNTSDINKPISTATQNALNNKQNTLVSGVNIKTVDGQSLLGTGDITLPTGPNIYTSDGTISEDREIKLGSSGSSLDILSPSLDSLFHISEIKTVLNKGIRIGESDGVRNGISIDGENSGLDFPVGVDVLGSPAMGVGINIYNEGNQTSSYNIGIVSVATGTRDNIALSLSAMAGISNIAIQVSAGDYKYRGGGYHIFEMNTSLSDGGFEWRNDSGATLMELDGTGTLRMEKYVDKTQSTVVGFTSPTIYGTHLVPLSIISEITSDRREGIVQKIYMQNSTTPTFPAGWVRLGGGTFSTTELNIIFAEYCGDGRVEYWIVQEN